MSRKQVTVDINFKYLIIFILLINFLLAEGSYTYKFIDTLDLHLYFVYIAAAFYTLFGGFFILTMMGISVSLPDNMPKSLINFGIGKNVLSILFTIVVPYVNIYVIKSITDEKYYHPEIQFPVDWTSDFGILIIVNILFLLYFCRSQNSK